MLGTFAAAAQFSVFRPPGAPDRSDAVGARQAAEAAEAGEILPLPVFPTDLGYRGIRGAEG